MRLRHLLSVAPSPSEIGEIGDGDEVTFAPMDALQDGLGGLDTSITKPLGEVRSGSYNFFADGDVLLAKVTPCFENGKKALATKLMNGIGFATSEVHVVRPNRSKLDPQFLIYLLSSEDFRAEGLKSMTGAGGLKRVSEKAILNYRLVVTDLPTQKRIRLPRPRNRAH
ncbi:restriction endonuclease subunit S [Marivita sp. GX14005]|uniref:restriction endonuclease subunit S n=1 Tax=Marivita sp. GX14005 TaxID=2942276 RepID=UPI0020186463|nr:restriction endonuclease subunit S [Marivita sp. GX14005]MCL3881029.1 restriction endonuclease subunit S [Marivita sp. GX14005]